ncbi:hypothetical protein PaecuDRAFT_1813 [Paenibacillus curdlanolyticus YK9]|uniref:YEATS-Like-Associating Three TM domain-containing protein n=1 Tax=Paenibacillus curdlanolyticus YK9 TaxID=717606 RepID=E0I862_9BACL|nr:YEATS-associated helix-containing protein [Paenibacillus curdlanolyticus]EFM11367.1 hypothetical protein PaecuDRAFT_1813 [Paenibacillus curdlanolyticus YK9]
MDHGIILVFIMIAAGWVGGAVSYMLPPAKAGSPPLLKDRELYKSMLIGIAASFMVPLFLKLISSDLLSADQLGKGGFDASNDLVFAGFCLMAAISSRKFIEMITNHALETLSRKVDQTNQAAEAVVDSLTEDSATAGDAAEPVFKTLMLQPEEQNRASVLYALTKSSFTFRTPEGICRDCSLDDATVNKVLAGLAADRLVEQTLRPQGVRFHITPLGRAKLGEYR